MHLEPIQPYLFIFLCNPSQTMSEFKIKNIYLDFESGEIFRQIPVSCLTSDINILSRVTKIALDSTRKVFDLLCDLNFNLNTVQIRGGNFLKQ